MPIKTNQSLADIIKTTRHPKKPDAFVSSEAIADAVNEAGYFKWADIFKVTGEMRDEALKAFYPGIGSIGELQTGEGGAHEKADQRMVNALYAAFRIFTNNSKK
jgi:hypothetical protein